MGWETLTIYIMIEHDLTIVFMGWETLTIYNMI